MSLLAKEDADSLKQRFQEELKGNVRIIVFIQNQDCKYCRETAQIAREVADLDSRISAEVYNMAESKEMASKFGVELIPATIIMGDADYRIRYYGIPSGHEFSTYIEDVVNVSKGDPNLSKETLESLGKIDNDVHMKIFVTPTCPYCPRMVLMAHQFAMANDRIRSDMIEAVEFPQLARKYNVTGVPRTVVNETNMVVGLLPEKIFVEFLLNSIGKVERISPRLEGALKMTELEAVEYTEHQHEH